MTGLSPAPIGEADVLAFVAGSVHDVQAYGLGNGQTYQDVSGSRAFDTAYQNTTGQSIFVRVTEEVNTALAKSLRWSADNVTYVEADAKETAAHIRTSWVAIIPSGHYYKMDGGTVLRGWGEMR